MQSLKKTPYEDIISGHSVNTSVPLILVRELLPLMGQIAAPVDASSMPSKPLACIINVSSHEGIYGSSANSGEKAGHHICTKASKAGLHIITETEAAACWKSRHVAMNTVDPGHMSVAPEGRDKGHVRLCSKMALEGRCGL